MVFSGTKIRFKEQPDRVINFLRGIFIYRCYFRVKLPILIGNDDGILWQNYFVNSAAIFLWFFQERQFDQR